MTELKSDLNILELVGEIIAFQVHVGVITFEAHKTRIGVHFILIEINHIPRTFLIRNDFSLFIVFLVALDIVGYKATQFRGYVPINVAKSQQEPVFMQVDLLVHIVEVSVGRKHLV